ncbi:MAG: OmpA family protein [Pseudomonadota bacterium]|nr:OmpA family protein [Pseudomonadota bacterium]
MKSVSRFLSVVTLTVAAGMVMSCAHESVSEYPRQSAIDARRVDATHRLNQQCAMMAASKIDVVVHFDSNSAKITPAAEAQIKQAAAIISSPNFVGSHVAVDGYTDAVGKGPRNANLSYRRAQVVVHELVTKYGIPASLLSAHGLGAANPVATNSTPAGRAANRRVTFAVTATKQ